MGGKHHLKGGLEEGMERDLFSDISEYETDCGVETTHDASWDSPESEKDANGMPRFTSREIVVGCEYKAILKQHSPLYLKYHYVEKSSGGWLDLIEDNDALVLFGAGFGGIIRPSSTVNSGVCCRWKALPTEKYYLAASVETMLRIYEDAGHPLKTSCRPHRQYLSSSGKNLQWHQGSSSLFEPCLETRGEDYICNRLQQILRDWPWNSIKGPLDLCNNPQGAVIFGASGQLSNVITAEHSRKEALYWQRNAHLGSEKELEASDESEDLSIDSLACIRASDHSGTSTATSMSFFSYSQNERASTTVFDMISDLPMNRSLESKLTIHDNSQSSYSREAFQSDTDEPKTRMCTKHIGYPDTVSISRPLPSHASSTPTFEDEAIADPPKTPPLVLSDRRKTPTNRPRRAYEDLGRAAQVALQATKDPPYSSSARDER